MLKLWNNLGRIDSIILSLPSHEYGVFFHLFGLPLFSLNVFVHLGCYNKIPPTGQLINNRNLFLGVLEAESPRLRCQPDCLLVRTTLFLVHSWCLPSVSTLSRRGKTALWSFLYKGTNPIHEGSELVTQHIPKAPPPNTIIFGGQDFSI